MFEFVRRDRVLDDHKSKFWEQMNYMKLSQEFPREVRKSPELRYSLGPAL
jgi:hypothetical protein